MNRSSNPKDIKKEEIEDAFKTDFTKKRPQNICKASLLTSMFATQKEHEDHQKKEGIEQDNQLVVDDLSSSLKRNVDWEHHNAFHVDSRQDGSFHGEMDWNDNFSRW
jgi:3-mercaptopyruvate sulfurtransferase SseA